MRSNEGWPDAPFLLLCDDRRVTEIDNWMFHTNADIAFLLVTEDGTAPDVTGYGRVGGAAIRLTSTRPFALSTITYALGDNTAIHELGHVFDGRHENDTNSGLFHPVVAADCSWMTIMGGHLAPCGFDGLPATTVRINYFSNPALNPAVAGGNVIGVPGSADMESWLETKMPEVSAWRNNGAASTPALPASIWHVSLMCWGDNRIAWSSVSGASGVRGDVQRFPCADPGVPGQRHHINVSVPAGGKFYRVHACNSAGCSHWTGTEHALYFAGCP